MKRMRLGVTIVEGQNDSIFLRCLVTCKGIKKRYYLGKWKVETWRSFEDENVDDKNNK